MRHTWGVPTSMILLMFERVDVLFAGASVACRVGVFSAHSGGFDATHAAGS